MLKKLLQFYHFSGHLEYFKMTKGVDPHSLNIWIALNTKAIFSREKEKYQIFGWGKNQKLFGLPAIIVIHDLSKILKAILNLVILKTYILDHPVPILSKSYV